MVLSMEYSVARLDVHALLAPNLHNHEGLSRPRKTPHLLNTKAKQSLHRRPLCSTLVADLSDV